MLKQCRGSGEREKGTRMTRSHVASRKVNQYLKSLVIAQCVLHSIYLSLLTLLYKGRCYCPRCQPYGCGGFREGWGDWCFVAERSKFPQVAVPSAYASSICGYLQITSLVSFHHPLAALGTFSNLSVDKPFCVTGLYGKEKSRNQRLTIVLYVHNVPKTQLCATLYMRG